MSLEPFRRGAGIVDRSRRIKLHFRGEQALWFLDQLLTNELESLGPGEGAEALLLTPKGRIVAVARVIATGSSAFLDADGPPDLAEFFAGRVFATKAEIADRSEDFAIISVLGPRADEVATSALAALASKEASEQRALGAELPGGSEHHCTHIGSGVAVRVTRPVPGLDLWLKKESAPQAIEGLVRAGAENTSEEQFGDLCVIEGLPRFGADFDRSFLPQEAALERMVHFEKGCYLGQEAVAMAQRGMVKRRLRHLRFLGGAATGSVFHDDRQAGSVSSAAVEGGTGFGIGAVSTSVPAGSEVEVRTEEGAVLAATIHDFPGSVAGPRVPSARELRERIQGR